MTTKYEQRESNFFVFDEILLGGAALFAAAKAAKELRTRHRQQLERALLHINKALDRHHRHLVGTEPTTDRSQKALMTDITAAKTALQEALRSEQTKKSRTR